MPPPPFVSKKFLQHTCFKVISAMRRSFYAIFVRVLGLPPPPSWLPPSPSPTLKVVQEWEGVGVWADATPPPPRGWIE